MTDAPSVYRQVCSLRPSGMGGNVPEAVVKVVRKPPFTIEGADIRAAHRPASRVELTLREHGAIDDDGAPEAENGQ
jgi:hypothetical protein